MFLNTIIKFISDLFAHSQEQEFSQEFFKKLKKKDYKKIIKKVYFERTGKELNIDNPRTFSEKIQWLKLYDNLPIKSILSDKLQVREWVKRKTEELEFPEIYGIWSSFEDIDFNNMPDKFVLKTNHASRMNLFIEDKSSLDSEAKEKINKIFTKWLNTNFAFSYGFELQYKHIKPRIFAEELLGFSTGKPIDEYCVMCFNGEPKFIEHLVHEKGQEVRRATYNINWEKQFFTHTHPFYEGALEKPKHFCKMIKIAKILADNFKLVRVDFNEVEGKLYFGEMTFTPCSGHMVYEPEEYDRILGDMLDLDLKNSDKIIY